MGTRTNVARALRGVGLTRVVDAPAFRRMTGAPIYRRHLTVKDTNVAPEMPTEATVTSQQRPPQHERLAADLRRIPSASDTVRDLLNRAADHVRSRERVEGFEAVAHLVELGIFAPPILKALADLIGGAPDLARRAKVLRLAADGLPGDGRVEALAGDAHFDLTQYAEAVRLYTAAREHNQAGERQLYREGIARQRLDDRSASTQFAAAVATSKSSTVRKYGIAALHEKYGQWELAATEYAANWTALGAQPGTAYRAAVAYERIFEWETALEWFKVAAGEAPSDGAVRYKVALTAERIGSFRAAIESYAYAVTIGAKNAAYCKYRAGVCAAHLGDLDRAFTYLVASYPPSPSPLERRETGPMTEIDLQVTEDARRVLREEALRASGVQDRAENHLQHAVRAAQLDDLELAGLELLEYVEATPYVPQNRIAGIAEALSGLGRRDVAVAALLRARKFGDRDGLDVSALTKDRGQRRAALVADIHDREELRPDLILLESYWGTTLSCHPLAIYRELARRESPLRPVWVYQKNAVIPVDVLNDPRVILVEYGTDEYFYYLCVAGSLVNNTSFEPSFYRRPGQKYLNTWHGTPLKTLGKSIRTGVLEHDNVSKGMLQATHLISPNQHTSDVLRTEFDISALSEAELLEAGSPRLDPLVVRDEHREEATRRALGLANTANRIVLYAPTWRGSASDRKMIDAERLVQDLEAMQRVPGVEVVFRGHHLVEAELDGLELDALVAPRGIDTYELLAVADVLVSDYSSLLFDFLATDRCVIAYVPDEEEYREERGLYFSPDEVTSWIARTPEELSELVEASAGFTPDADYAAAKEKFAAHEDGHAAARSLDFLTGTLSGECIRVPGPTLVTFASMIPNGITTAYLNLMHSLTSTPTNLALMVDSSAIRKDPRRAATVERLPDSVSIVCKVGAAAASLRERQAMADFARLRRFTSDRHREICRRAYAREIRRLLGGWTPTVAVEFEGYSNYWTPLFGMGFTNNPSVAFLHSEMELEITSRFPYLLTNVAVYREFDRLAAVSSATAEINRIYLNSLEPDLGERIRVVPNTIDADSMLRRAVEFEPDSTPGNPEIVSVGRLSASKNHEALVAAIGILREDFPEIRLTIVGDGPLRESLESQIAHADLGEHINLTGFVENPMPYVKAGDVFALPSLHEGQPMVFFEAAVLDKPIVVGDNPGSIEMLDYINGRVSGPKPPEIANTLREVLAAQRHSGFDRERYQERAVGEFLRLIDELS